MFRSRILAASFGVCFRVYVCFRGYIVNASRRYPSDAKCRGARMLSPPPLTHVSSNGTLARSTMHTNKPSACTIRETKHYHWSPVIYICNAAIGFDHLTEDRLSLSYRRSLRTLSSRLWGHMLVGVRVRCRFIGSAAVKEGYTLESLYVSGCRCKTRNFRLVDEIPSTKQQPSHPHRVECWQTYSLYT